MKTRTLILALALLPLLSFANGTATLTGNTAEMETVSAEDLSLENWMTEPASWPVMTKTDTRAFAKAQAEIVENEISLEDWMLEPANSTWNSYEVEQETEVENWMYEPSTWLISE